MKGKLYDPATETLWFSLRSCILFLEFRYAACSEKLWMLVGLISASFAGLCIPAIVVLFGKLAEEFINFEVIKVHEEGVQMKRSRTLDPAGLRWYPEGNSTYFTRSVIGTTVDLALYTVILGFAQLLLGAIFTASLNYSAQKQLNRVKCTDRRNRLIGRFSGERPDRDLLLLMEDVSKCSLIWNTL